MVVAPTRLISKLVVPFLKGEYLTLSHLGSPTECKKGFGVSYLSNSYLIKSPMNLGIWMDDLKHKASFKLVSNLKLWNKFFFLSYRKTAWNNIKNVSYVLGSAFTFFLFCLFSQMNLPALIFYWLYQQCILVILKGGKELII